MKIGLVAGEASGDLLGAGLIREIRARVPDATFEGIAGPAMTDAGCDCWADAEDLAVMGIIEPLAHLPKLLRLRSSIAKRWVASPPDVFVGIDAPDFNFSLEKKLRRSGIRTAHYVSPTIWAWRAGRINTVRKAADRVLCILPFEKTLYDEAGIDAVFVGHPKATSLPTDIDIASVREVLDIGDGPVVAVLPGSRMSEINRLGAAFATTAKMLLKHREDLRFITPVATERLRPAIEAVLAEAGVSDHFCLVDDSVEAMSAADVVLLASGTAALESALLAKPTVAAYRVAGLSAKLIRLIGIKTPYFTMPNLLTEEPLIPEFIQDDVRPAAIAQAVWELLGDEARREAISSRFAKMRAELALGADERAAEAVIELAQ